MKFTFLLPLCFLIAIGVNAQKTKSLFNGKNLDGWKALNGYADFHVEDGVIVGITTKGSPSTYLATINEYTNFILEYEIKMDSLLNGGVQIRSQYDESKGDNSVFGPQVEADDSPRAWTGGIYDQSRKGWRYNLELNEEGKKAYKNQEWNKVKVIAAGNRISTWVNGVNCANLIEENSEKGFVALQVHAGGGAKIGKATRWKNITIKEIAEDYKFKTTAPVVSYLLNTLSEEEKHSGWKMLWDGKSTKGWRGAKKDDFPAKGWSMNDGILTVHASGGGESENGGDIVTTRAYSNFILELDFKITEGANSGIKYFVDTELNKGKGSAIGCEFQILDDKNHPDAKMGVGGKRTLGSLYDLMKANAQEYIPSLYTNKYVNGNSWNRARIVVDGKHVQHWLNGCKVVEYERGTQEWRELVVYSKYAKWPNFGEAKEGLLLLQDHGDEVHFKNIKIKEL
ncbi:hypothetical protein BZG02_05370 [Labilibaculum filiforme]|uniref:3-keto-alpha-glucoside-1,2-lyase/3-keto-2-hydroxy-glucal hydratase domain-containing protein n=1 Tax=Labilibaculum filiforme TaxID=1940526 RepID=A0A2N3I1X9_9BACT|nr:DUF1080 domain-containing protein [Labilibaculum filiforme]PKQ64253.1 hypothetical protein BZG02_05370 [Labilibaculum filiforme]